MLDNFRIVEKKEEVGGKMELGSFYFHSYLLFLL